VVAVNAELGFQGWLEGAMEGLDLEALRGEGGEAAQR
jgi:hypothetical protein